MIKKWRKVHSNLTSGSQVKINTCMDTQQRNFPLVYMFSAGQSHLLILIPETRGNLRLWFDTLLPSFQEQVMSFESNL